MWQHLFCMAGQRCLGRGFYPCLLLQKGNGDRQQKGCLGKGIYEDRI